jgi:hypothetical protein
MFARLTAKAILAAAAIAMAFFGIGFMGMAIATALVAAIGPVWGYIVAGVIFLVPPVLWALVMHWARPAKPQAQPSMAANPLVRTLFAAVAKETPWIAIVGAGLAGAADLFLNRNKPQK